MFSPKLKEKENLEEMPKHKFYCSYVDPCGVLVWKRVEKHHEVVNPSIDELLGGGRTNNSPIVKITLTQ